MAGRPSRKERILELERENAELRTRLDAIDNGDPANTFDLIPAQQTRDALAVRALFTHHGNIRGALMQLGFDMREMKPEQIRGLAKQVFDTPGVVELLSKELANLEQHREALVARQVQIALTESPENATRAMALLAKLAGWTKSEVTIDARRQSVYQLFGNGNETRNGETPAIEGGKDGTPLSLSDVLAHEPGDPIPVDVSEDLGDA